jgi:hypothetical protein
MDPAQKALFKQAVFRGAPFPAGWGADFAIITAYDPEGKVATAADNAAADLALEAELRADGLNPHRVTGGSVDGTHAEPGWAVELGLAEAIEHGRRYRQLAVFHVRGGRLALVDCADGMVEDLGRPFRLV